MELKCAHPGSKDTGAKAIIDAIDMAGAEGHVVIELGSSIDPEVTRILGFRFPMGYLSPYFVNIQQNQTADLDSPFVLLYNQTLGSISELLPVLEAVARSGRPLLIIADNVEGEALSTLVVNCIRGILKVAVVRAPHSDEMRSATMQDFAALTGGTVVSSGLAASGAELSLTELGEARRVLVEKSETTVLGGKGNQRALNSRIELLREALAAAGSSREMDQLRERIARLTNLVVTISVGGATQMEAKDNVAKGSAALMALTSAIRGGIIGGGGAGLLVAADALEGLPFSRSQQPGVGAVRRACEEPLRQIAINAGHNPDEAVQSVRKQKDALFAYDARHDSLENILRSDVVDSAFVVGVAIEEAFSIVSAFLLPGAVSEEVIVPLASDSTDGSSTF